MTGTIIVGVGGGSCAGKSTLVRGVAAAFPPGEVVVIEHDAYYRDQSHLPLVERARLNFDHPDAFENTLLIFHLQELRQGRAVEAPVYDYITHTRRAATRHIEPAPLLLLDGILALADPELRRMMDLRVYIDALAGTRLARRLRRDVWERGRTPQSVAEQYEATVAPMYERFVAPCRDYADLVLSGEDGPEVSIGLLVARLRELRQP